MQPRVALFGGSFNPPHAGHAQVVLHLLHAGFDEVWAIPAGVHPFGKELAPFSHREAMLRLALSDFGPRVRVCLIEAELPAPSRTFDTVSELVRRYPGRAFHLALGEDQRADLPRWHRIADLRELVPFFFVGRGAWTSGDDQVRIPDYSSTELRRRFAAGEIPRGWLHARVCDYILARGLYGSRRSPAAGRPRCAVVGLGRVGGSLVSTLLAAGLAPAWGADPDPGRRERVGASELPLFSDWIEAWRRDPDVDLLFFCTPDPWRPQAPAGLFTTAPACLHTGGMHRPAEVLAGLGLPPERLGIMHPVRSVPEPGIDLRDGWFSFTGGAPLREALEPLVALLRLRLAVVGEADRMAFHAACALAANGSQVLEARAAGLFGALGLGSEEARALVGQLVRSALEGWEAGGPAGFTGPWARGDEAVSELHRHALTRLAPELEPMYLALKAAAGSQGGGAPGGPPGDGTGGENVPE